MMLSYIALAEAVALAFLAGIALVQDAHSRLNRAYSVLALASALWAFAYTGVYAAKGETSVWLWYRISAVGWCSTIPAMLMLTLTFTNQLDKMASKILIIVAVAYSAALLAVQLTGTLFVQGFVPTSLGNAELVDIRKPGYVFMLGPMLAATVWTIVAYARSITLQPSRRRRRLSCLMLVCIAITVPAGIFSNMVLSIFLNQMVPSMGIFALIFLLGGALPIVVHYREISPLVLRSLVADVIEDTIIVLNRTEAEACGRGVVPDSLRPHFMEPSHLIQAVSASIARKTPVELQSDIIEDVRERRAEVRVSSLFSGDENTGCVVVIKANRDFSRRADEFCLSPQERKIVARILEGLSSKEIAFQMALSPGTVRNYTSTVFRKTGARGRSDLIRLFVPGL